MSFFAIFLALLLEQARPLGRDNTAHRLATAWRRWVRRSLDAGQAPHGWMAWSAAALVPALLAALVHWLLLPFSDLLVFAWTVGVLYLTLGFRQFSHYFTTIRQALESNDEATARAQLAEWQQVEVGELPRQELLRHVIEHSALAAHHHVFGVLFAYSVFAALGFGPAGAVLYRMAESLARRWQPRLQDAPSSAVQQAVRLRWPLPWSATSRRRLRPGARTPPAPPRAMTASCWPPPRAPSMSGSAAWDWAPIPAPTRLAAPSCPMSGAKAANRRTPI